MNDEVQIMIDIILELPIPIPDELRTRLNRVRQQHRLAALWPGMTFGDAIALTELEIVRGGQDGNLNQGPGTH